MLRAAGSRVVRLIKRVVILVMLVVLTVLAVRAWDSQGGAPLALWQTYAPEELNADEIEKADWPAYLVAETAVFDAVRANVTAKLEPADRVTANRYFDGSPLYAKPGVHDWNRSFVLEPTGPPAGVAVFVHGMTDGPYSLRHVAAFYRDRGFIAVGLRLPGHGTVPAGLTAVDWETWAAAARLAVREARRRVPAPLPLHVVGYSLGGALALQYALDTLIDPALFRPDRVVLISPMIGVSEAARFAGVVGLPALLPAFAKAAWLDLLPEFNPFKYNSFPVNAARQSSLLSRAVQRQILARSEDGRLATLPPVLTFQSVVDATVSTPAVLTSLYGHLPANGSELVLFDLNRSEVFGPLLRDGTAPETLLSGLLPSPRRFRTVIVTNTGTGTRDVVEQAVDAATTHVQHRALGLAFPPQVYSLSHVALPFPVTDPVYGIQPESNEFGINLGSLAVRGERGTLVVGADSLTRMSSNPFYPYLIERIAAGLPITTP